MMTGKLKYALTALICLCSCQTRLEIPADQAGDGLHTFIVSTDGENDESKTVLSGYKNYWSGNEAIQVLGTGGSYRFEAVVDSPVTSTTFSYGGGEFSEAEVIAVYPAQGSSKYSANLTTKSVSGVSIPVKQTACENSYDPNAALSVAYSSSNSIHFKNVTALLKFTVGSSGVNNVTFHANGEKLSGKCSVAYNDGNPVVSSVTDTYVEMSGKLEQGKTYYIAIKPGTYSKGIGIEFNKMACKTKSSAVSFERNRIYDLGLISFPGSSENNLPADAKHGINYNSDGSVTLVLYEKDNQGWHYDSCYLLGDFNNWTRTDAHKMHRHEDKGIWWITLSGLDPKTEYRYQYELVTGSSTVRIHDPYSEIVYDEHNDKYISSSTYFGMPSFPSGAWNNISAFQIERQDKYEWAVDNFKIEDKDDIVIYELLLRDFTAKHDLHGAIEQLDYLQKLGIGAIELMPVQEFDGNLSWGYNPCSYFALDKAYGTRWDYKHFIDECHKRGIAVLFDVTYNHATGAHPYAKMYWDSQGNKTSWTNPFFNEYAPHQFSVYHDWNHSNWMVREHVKRSLEYLLKEYRVDGFRFDLSKGFTQNSGTESSYDDSRVNIIKEYHNAIKAVNPDAIMICEHFCDAENWELGANGIKVWRKMCAPYGQSAMGHSDNAAFWGLREDSGVRFGTFVGYMESHDEERLGYLAENYGTDRVKKDYTLRLQRAALNAAFFLLVPGPKMIWQFGELGYEISINYGGVNTAEKPVKTEEYMANEHRKALYECYAALLKFRKENPRFFDNDASFSWKVGDNDWPGRSITCKSAEGKYFVLFGNFGYGDNTISVNLPHGGKWYNALDHREDNCWNGSNHNPTLHEGEFYLLTDF